MAAHLPDSESRLEMLGAVDAQCVRELGDGQKVLRVLQVI
jgi:hypothetical protein